jgi:hypothetical protein
MYVTFQPYSLQGPLKFTQIRIFGMKIYYHLATLISTAARKRRFNSSDRQHLNEGASEFIGTPQDFTLIYQHLLYFITNIYRDRCYDLKKIRA